MNWPRAQLWSHTDTITADTDKKLLLGALHLMGSWVALEWELLQGGSLWWQDWSWLWQRLCERLTLVDLQMQRESLSRRSYCSAVFVSLIAQLFENRCVLGVQAGNWSAEELFLLCSRKTGISGDFPKWCRWLWCRGTVNRLRESSISLKRQTWKCSIFALDVSVHFVCLFFFFLAQGQAEVCDRGVLPLSFLSPGFPSYLSIQLREAWHSYSCSTCSFESQQGKCGILGCPACSVIGNKR